MLKILLLKSQTYLESSIVPTTVFKTEFGKIAAEANMTGIGNDKRV